MHFRRKLSSLTALVALEAVARHRSISAAAREIGVTQAAISRHIAALEEDFGRPLFTRAHRAVQPTAECLLLARSLTDNFHGIAEAVDAMRTTSKDVVSIGAPVAFSHLWLVPRLLRFRALHPGSAFRVVSRDDRIDLGTGEVDMVIRFGKAPFPDGVVVSRKEDRIFPVCAPAYAARRDLTAFPDCAFELIEQDVPDRSWVRWADWFAQTGTRPAHARAALRFTYFTDTLAAALAGEGIAMGWEMLVREEVRTGRLVRVGNREITSEASYNLVVAQNAKSSAQVWTWSSRGWQRNSCLSFAMSALDILSTGCQSRPFREECARRVRSQLGR